MIKLTGGQWRGRNIKTPKGSATRPTSSRVREALFDILGPSVRGCDFYDLFAGSGVVGLEALSRGADRSTFIENGRAAILCLRDNIALLDCEESSVVRQQSVHAWLASSAFNPINPAVLFLDPPYDMKLAHKTLELLATLPTPGPESRCVAQTGRSETLQDSYGLWDLYRCYTYGDTLLWLYLPPEP